MPNNQLHSVCVLILNYQSFEDTIKYAECLQQQQNIDLSILIVDNCSPNDSYNILKTAYDKIENIEVILSEKNGGYAYGNNFGLRFLQNKNIDYILISNNDIEIDDSLLMYKLIQKYQDLKNPAFIAPLMYTNGKISKLSAWKTPTFWDDIVSSLRTTSLLFGDKTQYDLTIDSHQPMAVDCLSGAFFMGKKEVFFTVGLMDENTFLYGEEVILAQKVKMSNLQNFLIQDLHYNHENSQTISSILSQFKTRQYLNHSQTYYHQHYFGIHRYKLILLKVLLYVWRVETMLYKPLKSFIQNKNHYKIK